MDTLRVFLLVLAGLLSSLVLQASAQLSAEDCCKHGSDWATQKQDCSSLPDLSETPECRVIQKQCCSTTLEESYCRAGIQMYADHDKACEAPQNLSSCEATFVMKCCQCCQLGKKAQLNGQSCETDMLGYRCGQAFRACCVAESPNETPVGRNSPDVGPEDPLYLDNCRGGGPCAQGCTDTGSGVTCYCFQGYRLKPDGISCEDINECLTLSNPCHTGEKCINLIGSFRCQRVISCGTGYELMDNNVCQDIDECETRTDNCPPETICQNTQGSFRCRPREICNAGFIQDALGRCIDINECLGPNVPCPPGLTCLNTHGSYTCQRNVVSCGRGYHTNAEGTRCVDVDECSESSNPCGHGHSCTNTIGSYRCECLTGYYFDSSSRRCVDTDECRRYPGRLCAHRCENTPGSYHCSCTMGFKLAADGRNCEDVNECDSNPCSQECANVYGSFQCYCRRGYQLSDVDGISCEDIDECALPTGGHICAYRCNNVPGSFLCTCPSSGYTLAPNGRSCQDIDECVTATHNCSGTEACFNIQGSFRCLFFECPKNYQKSGDSRCERVPCNENKECQSLPLRITYYHLTFPTNIQVPTNIFRMGPSNTIPGDNILLSITSGNEEGYFSAQTLNNYTGIVAAQRQITEPKDFILTVEMKLIRYGVVTTFVSKIYVFVTAEL